MKNFKNISILTLILLWCLAPCRAFATSAEKGNFIVLGRADEAGPANEMVNLWEQPGEFDIVHTQVQSDTTVLIVDKTRVNSKDYYLVSTVGKGGGLMGWVSEEYIYEILPGQPQE